MEEDNLRDDLEAAITEAGDTYEEEAGGIIEASEPAAPEVTKADEATPDEETRPTEAKPKEAESKDTDEVVPDAFVADPHHGDDATRYPTLTKERIAVAPEGLRPVAREHWESIPDEVKREIHRRELDIAIGMQDASESRQFQTAFKQVTDPYASVLAADGEPDPLKAVAGIMGTLSELNMGAPQAKANRIARMISHYGIDIDLLDAALVSARDGTEAPPSNGADSSVQALVDARMKPFEDYMARQEADTAAGVTTEVDTFTQDAEFISEVRLDMADLLDTAAKRGRILSMQDAYEAACQMNPEVKAVLAQRVKAEGAAAGNSHIERKEAVARASVTGKASGTVGAISDGSLRGDLEKAIDQVEAR